MLSLTKIGAFRCFEGIFSLDTTSTGASDYVMINPDAQSVSVQLKVLSTAKAALEATISPTASVLADTADWKEWAAGDITGGAVEQDTPTSPITAVRINVKTTKAGLQAVLCVRTRGIN
jgi:type II secretory pathway component PulK